MSQQFHHHATPYLRLDFSLNNYSSDWGYKLLKPFHYLRQNETKSFPAARIDSLHNTLRSEPSRPPQLPRGGALRLAGN